MMSSVIRTPFSRRLSGVVALSFAAVIFVALAPATSCAQKPGADGNETQPSFSDFKGVRLGMTADESRKKLGNPRDKSDEQDFYVFNETQAVQIMYDKKGAVSAISIDFMSGANNIPTAKDVLGTDAESKPDGSLFKMIRYPKAGYWVSYNRTSGDAATVTIIMQKIQ